MITVKLSFLSKNKIYNMLYLLLKKVVFKIFCLFYFYKQKGLVLYK